MQISGFYYFDNDLQNSPFSSTLALKDFKYLGWYLSIIKCIWASFWWKATEIKSTCSATFSLPLKMVFLGLNKVSNKPSNEVIHIFGNHAVINCYSLFSALWYYDENNKTKLCGESSDAGWEYKNIALLMCKTIWSYKLDWVMFFRMIYAVRQIYTPILIANIFFSDLPSTLCL